MSFDPSAAHARMQRSLEAWRRVSESMRIVAFGRKTMPAHDRKSCPVCRVGVPGRCVFVDAMVVPEADLAILADGFDLMAELWGELDRTAKAEAGSSCHWCLQPLPHHTASCPVRVRDEPDEKRDLASDVRKLADRLWPGLPPPQR